MPASGSGIPIAKAAHKAEIMKDLISLQVASFNCLEHRIRCEPLPRKAMEVKTDKKSRQLYCYVMFEW